MALTKRKEIDDGFNKERKEIDDGFNKERENEKEKESAADMGYRTDLCRKVREPHCGLDHRAEQRLRDTLQEPRETIALPSFDRVRNDTADALPRPAQQMPPAEAETLENIARFRSRRISGVLLDVLLVQRDVGKRATESSEHSTGKVGEAIDPIVRQVYSAPSYSGVHLFKVSETKMRERESGGGGSEIERGT